MFVCVCVLYVLRSLDMRSIHLTYFEVHNVCVSCSVASDSLGSPWTVAHQAPLSWNSPGKNARVGYHSLLHGIFPTQGLNPALLHYRQILYRLSHQGTTQYKFTPIILPFFSLKKIVVNILSLFIFKSRYIKMHILRWTNQDILNYTNQTFFMSFQVYSFKN